MSKLDRFLAKPKTYTIGGEEIEIYPLTVKNLDVLIKLGDNNADIRANAFKELLKQTFKRSFPDVDESEYDNVSTEFLNEFVNAILDVNGFSDVDVKKLQEMKVS